MSHLSKIKTKFKNKNILKKTLEEMECEILEGNLNLNMPMRMDGKRDEPVDIIANPKKARKKDFMGFRLVNGEYELIGDVWGTGIDMDQFSVDLTASYAVSEVRNQFAETPGLAEFDLTSTYLNNKGETVLTYQKWA